MSKGVFILISFLLITSFSIGRLYGYTQEEAAKKAAERHEQAASDVIYAQDQELKALYYQNIQIIELLKDIRRLLEQSLNKE